MKLKLLITGTGTNRLYGAADYRGRVYEWFLTEADALYFIAAMRDAPHPPKDKPEQS